jgi:Kelch motif
LRCGEGKKVQGKETVMPGSWQSLKHQPSFCASTMLLLTDGTILCQQENGRQWWRLTPDRFGSYVRGTWSQVASMRNARMYYASAVLADGRVLAAGGKYNGSTGRVELNAAEVYDPKGDMWSDLPTPAGWTQIGDAASCVLADGRVLLGNLGDRRTAIFTPGPDTWSAGPQKGDTSSEESWALLADGTVLTVECSNGQQAEKYVPGSNQWVSASQTPAMLVETASSEIGPAALLPDGRCFFVGASGKTALYTSPTVATDPGTWTAGPDFPSSGNRAMGAKDAPGCLLPNGNFLCVAAPVTGQSADYLDANLLF